MRSPYHVIVTLLFAVIWAGPVAGDLPGARRGVVTRERIDAGEFFQYIPRKRSDSTTVAVIVHGSIFPPKTAVEKARAYIGRWQRFAEHTGIVLVAPAFDVENYASDHNAPGGSAWGYRALDGRTTTSDEFVHLILDRLQELDPEYDGRFYLYGHSAGAQFANHYLVVHPGRLHGVVLSAPAVYAMPDPQTAWPKGMKKKKHILRWGDVKKTFRVQHTRDTWIDAAELPVTVVIGTRDTERLSDQPQQGGWTRVDRAHHYVRQMKQFAVEHDVRPGVSIIAVPNVGHSSSRLTNACGRAMLSIVESRAE